MGAAVAQFPWAGDGIIEPEQLLLGELASLAGNHPGLAGKVVGYPWMSTANEISAPAHRGITAIRLAAAIDVDLAELLAGYRWLQGSITSIEANALSNIADLASHDMETAELLASSSGFVSGRTIERAADGAGNISAIFAANPALGEEVAGYPWIADGITQIEAAALATLHELLRTSGPANSGLAEKLAGHPWVADGITAIDMETLNDFLRLLEIAEEMDSGLAGNLAGYSWVADGITDYEGKLIDWLGEFLENAGAANFGFIEKVTGYPWIADGIALEEQESLGRILWLLDVAGAANFVSVQKLAGYSWIADGISGDELDALHIFPDLLRTAGVADSGLAEKVVSYSWVADGITVPEPDAIKETLNKAREGLNYI